LSQRYIRLYAHGIGQGFLQQQMKAIFIKASPHLRESVTRHDQQADQ
jgi:hypothetical protein